MRQPGRSPCPCPNRRPSFAEWIRADHLWELQSPAGIVQMCQGQVDDGAKESPSKFFELLAGKERNRRLLQLEGVEKGTNTEQSLC